MTDKNMRLFTLVVRLLLQIVFLSMALGYFWRGQLEVALLAVIAGEALNIRWQLQDWSRK